MKKYLLLLSLLLVTHYLFAAATQGHWRWRKDDGSETTATWLAGENVTPTISTYESIRVRIEEYNENDNDTYDLNNLKLQYSLTGLQDTWIDVNNDTTTHDFALVLYSIVADGSATTEQLSARSGYSFVPGRVIWTVAPFNYSIAPKTKTEFEYVIRPTVLAKFSTTYYFRLSEGGTDSNPLAVLTTAATLPVSLVSFTVTDVQGKASLSWTTANETNNDYFTVLRSSDGRGWQPVATIQAKGNNSQTRNNYEFTDNTPLGGNSYYRLKQSDKDGKSVLSEVKSFSLKDIRNLVASVYPNPTASAINIMIKDYTGAVTASVINTQGAVVFRQVLAVTPAITAYRLNLNQKLPAGTYQVNLSGSNLTHQLKVVVQ